MLFQNPPTSQIRSILLQAKTIAVVGISEREDRASNYVSDYMQSQGYKRTCYCASLNLLVTVLP